MKFVICVNEFILSVFIGDLDSASQKAHMLYKQD